MVDCDFGRCVLDSFDDDGVRRRFRRVSGVALTKDLRPLIERQMAEAAGSGPEKGEWKSEQVDERTAQLFILCVNEIIWMPLMAFVSEAEKALGQPERLAELRKDFEASVKRDGFWHKRIDTLTSWAATGRSGGHA
jgi:hypothetical protein